MAVRLVIHRSGERLVSDLKDGVYKVGREQPADLVIPDPTVSGMHAELQVKGTTCSVRDLSSRNGTTVNGVPAKAATPLRESDEIRFGSVVATIEIVQPARQPQAPLASGLVIPGQAAPVVPEAAKVAKGMRWSLRDWIAGAIAIVCMLLLSALVVGYTERTNAKTRRAFRFREFAAQYVHVLTPASTTADAPSLDESLKGTIMVLGRNGEVLYPPASAGQKRPSPLLNSKQIPYPEAKDDLFAIPGQPEGTYSYPIRNAGELLGFVVATAAEDNDSALGVTLTCLLLATLLALIILFFALRPIHTAVRDEVERMRANVAAVANHIVAAFPRSSSLPELNGLAEEVERVMGRQAVAARAGGGEGAAAGAGRQYDADLADLIGTAEMPYCFVDSDYNVLYVSRDLKRFEEFSRITAGTSIFAGGLSTVQSRELVQMINDTSTSAPLRLDLSRDGKPRGFDVFTRSFSRSGTRLIGLLFAPVRA